MNYKLIFKKGNLGTIKVKGNVIEAYIKLSDRPPEAGSLKHTYKIIDGRKHYDTHFTRYSALALAMQKLNDSLPDKNLTIEIQKWMDLNIAMRIIEGELGNLENITYSK
jgi:hypothetical protein